MRRKVTIRDVAAMAEVSNQTVSRVINDRPDVSDETRKRVWEVIETLNFQPNVIARSLIQQRSLALGVVTAGLGFLGPSQALNGIAAQAESLGYTLLLKELSDFRANDIKPLLNTLLARQVEGIIWAVPEVGDNRAWIEPQLPGLVIPAIFLTMEAESGVSIASIDNYLGGRMATEHLIQQGCSHIAHISGPLDWWEARQRKMGWNDALKNARLPISENQHVTGNWSASSGAEGIARLLEIYPEMDAVFVANDQMALGALQVANQRGIQIPKNLAMVGFDGIPETAYYCPPLSTVYQDMSALGSIAVRELVNAIEANHLEHAVFEPEQITLQPELVIRESSVLSRG